MPYKSERIIIAHTKLDKRIKLTSEDKNKIKKLHKEGYSQRQLAKLFNVSRRLIQFIINPIAQELNKKNREERGGWKQYYDKDKHKNYTKKHRRYKQELYLNNKIKGEKTK